VLVASLWNNGNLWIAKNVCAYLVAAFVLVSWLNYSIVVARRLHHGS
jgi:hypothetical protein